MMSDLIILLIVLICVSYGIYEKHCETKQIEAVSKISGLTYQELKDLIKEIKK